MRDIIFRAIQTGTDEFVYGCPHSTYGGGIDSLQDDESGDSEYIRTDTLGQYTGLNDKNGLRIFEGDIVSLDGFNPAKYEVKFIEGGFCYCHKDLKDFPVDINMGTSSTGNHQEVIGNIHQSKEKAPTKA